MADGNGISLNLSKEENIIINGESASDTLKLYSFIINVCINGTFCLSGYFGNIMTIIVLQKDRVKTSNSILLQALAVFDSCFLASIFWYIVLRSVYPFTGGLKNYYDYASPYIIAYILPLAWTSQTSTIWMVVLIALDRWIIVSQPLKSGVICTPKNAKKAVVVLTISALLFNAPRWPHYYQVGFPEEHNNSTTTFISHIAFNNNLWNPELYRKIYHVSLTLIFLFIIPFSMLIILNTKLITTLRKAQRLRATMTNQQTKQSTSNTNVNLMMVIIITTFLICQLPDFVASIVGAGQFQIDPTTYKYYAGIVGALLVLNSSINFYLYCLFYKRFNQILCQIFSRNKPMEEYSVTIETLA